ncbi:MAG: Maf family protein, partial [Acidobacteria bacterium]|nr:Maf family protein [Acidobacteriota bacterium]
MYHRDHREPLVLASASPRRAALLAGAGRAFEVVPATVDKRQQTGEQARQYVDRKAQTESGAARR